MKLAIYGGSFNPPHLAHARLAELAYKHLKPDTMLIIPAASPPHKKLAENSPKNDERLHLTRLAFEGYRFAEVSEIEILRGVKSYTSDTVMQLKMDYPGAEITLILGSDMLLEFKTWHKFDWLLSNVSLLVLTREKDEGEKLKAFASKLKKEHGASIDFIMSDALVMSSGEIRAQLPNRKGNDKLNSLVYEEIIKKRFYSAKPNLLWLFDECRRFISPARLSHVKGCMTEAVSLAKRWGADEDLAAEAAILHDITKKLTYDEHLLLGNKYAIIFDEFQLKNVKLMHAITGAMLASDLFGISSEVKNTIRWHTTGRADMSLLEKIIYLADFIEPTRDFEEVVELRELAYKDIDAAMLKGLTISLKELNNNGISPDTSTLDAIRWYGGESIEIIRR